MDRLATPRRSRGIGALIVAGAVLAVVASGCGPAPKDPADPSHAAGPASSPSPSRSAVATPTATATPMPNDATPAPQATPDTLPLHTVSVGTCCTVSVPQDWLVNGPNSVGTYVAEGANPALAFTLTTVGTSASCPAEPVSAEDESRSIVRRDAVTINGEPITAWVTADADTTYQYIDADVVVGGLCLDVGGQEFGVASSDNRGFLESIMESVVALPSLSPGLSPSAEVAG
ncbi:MAG: hypothetical protein ABSA40_04640 [Candidatus Dormibacteria bacterium]